MDGKILLKIIVKK